MKSATIPAVRVAPELRAEVEQVLEEGETLSAFVASALADSVQRRRAQGEFLKRGMASLAKARRTGVWVEPEAVLEKLEARLRAAQTRKGRAVSKA
jgi:predicted transcriptional regulator